MAVVWRFCVILCFCYAAVAYTPERQADWAEPDAETYVARCSGCQPVSRQSALLRLTALREVMAANNVDAYIVPTADAHNSQYIAAADARREWISGLSGSSGTAVVTAVKALVWTDARYFTQFFMQVDTDHWELMRQGTDLSINDWLAQNMANGSVVAVDPTTYTRSAWNTLQTRLSREGVILSAVPANLVDLARAAVNDPAPARDNNPLITHPVQFTGEPSMQKISKILEEMNQRGATALVLTALDDIAYTLNLRGTDIPHNPVFFSYLIIRNDQVSPNNVVLFWGNGTLAADVTEHLNSEGTSIETRPYEDIFEYLRNMSSFLPDGSTIWLSDDASHAVFSALEAGGSTNLLSSLSPVALMKCVKNEVELEGFRRAHVKDGTALIRFMRWIHEQVDAGANVTEINVVDKLLELRSEEADFMGASFETIAGAGEHGAVIHYKPERDGEQRVIKKQDMLLVDSGGHFR
ncbi:metallopeptidase family m24 domain-containing protein [Phthorimaea operculella]|nr:metallopeptidase family m24 domain-containing protein [Phthorimaea operculella]